MDNVEAKAKQYAKNKYKVFFVNLIFSGVFLVTVLYMGLNFLIRDISYSLSGNLYVGVFIFLTMFGFLYWFSFLPLDFYSTFLLEHKFSLSNQTFFLWAKQYLKQMLISSLIVLLLIELLYLFMKNFPSTWWIWISLVWIFFSIVLAKVTPIFIIPLFYKLVSLKDEVLKGRLKNLVTSSGLKVDSIMQMDLSKDTKKANAAFSGIGKSKRILLSDTLLSSFSHDEIEVVLAHEIAHKKFAHIWKHILFGAFITFLSTFILKVILDNYGMRLGYFVVYDVANFPFIFLYIFVFGILFSPIQNAFSRFLERQADRYAILLSKNKEAFISTMEKLSIQNLSDKEPPFIMEVLMYDHPPISKRIKLASNVKTNP